MDASILLWIQDYIRNDFFTPVFRTLSALGDNGIIWIAIAVVLLLYKKYRKVGFLISLSLIGSLLINNMFLKNTIARPRPYNVVPGLTRLVPALTDYSFPSGHTGSSFAAAVIIALYMPKKYGVPALILAILIAFSRLYLGVHYPTDILGGMITGTGIALFIRFIDDNVAKRRHTDTK